MENNEYLKHAWKLYYEAVDAEGARRRQLLQQAQNILNNVPVGYSNREELLSRINDML